MPPINPGPTSQTSANDPSNVALATDSSKIDRIEVKEIVPDPSRHIFSPIRNAKNISPWLFGPAILIGLSVTVAVFGTPGNQTERFQSTLFGASISLAAFSVNFSLVSYQFSPYRSILREFPRTQGLLAGLLLALALTPLLSITGVLPPVWLPTMSTAIVPLVAAAGLFLLAAAGRSSDPKEVIKASSDRKTIVAFATNVALETHKQLRLNQAAPLVAVDQVPIHEFDDPMIQIAREQDPIRTLSQIGRLAIIAEDTSTFAHSARALCSAITITNQLDFPETIKTNSLRIRAHLLSHVHSALEGVGLEAVERDRTGASAGIFFDVCRQFAHNHAHDATDGSSRAREMLQLMANVARSALTKGNRAPALATIILARQILHSSFADANEKLETIAANYLASITYVISSIGKAAIEAEDTELLYRCLDAYGWTGCAAVKAEEFAIAQACSRQLVYLGRLARARELECFWPRCALAPHDHAWQRLEWMLSHAQKRLPYMELLAEAFSALGGSETDITWEDRRPTITIKKEPFVINVSNGTRSAKIDFSNPKMTREYWY